MCPRWSDGESSLPGSCHSSFKSTTPPIWQMSCSRSQSLRSWFYAGAVNPFCSAPRDKSEIAEKTDLRKENTSLLRTASAPTFSCSQPLPDFSKIDQGTSSLAVLFLLIPFQCQASEQEGQSGWVLTSEKGTLAGGQRPG